MINMTRFAVCPRILTVNDYRESHTKVLVANVARTITCHMNYRWGSSFQLLCYTRKGIYHSGEIRVTGLVSVIRTFYAYLQYIRSPS